MLSVLHAAEALNSCSGRKPDIRADSFCIRSMLVAAPRCSCQSVRTCGPVEERESPCLQVSSKPVEVGNFAPLQRPTKPVPAAVLLLLTSEDAHPVTKADQLPELQIWP